MHADVGFADEERGEELFATSLALSIAHPNEVAGTNGFAVSPHW